MAEDPVANEKVVVGPSRRETGRADAHRLQDTAGSQLLDASLGIKLKGGLVVVGLDAPDVVRGRLVQRRHQKVQRVPELTPHRLLIGRLLWLLT